MTSGSQEERAVTGWINPAAFSAAPAFTFGDVPRTNADVARTRPTHDRPRDLEDGLVHGGKSLSFRADVLNMFDDPLFSGPVTTFGTTNVRPNHHGRRLRPIGPVPGSVGFLDSRRVGPTEVGPSGRRSGSRPQEDFNE